MKKIIFSYIPVLLLGIGILFSGCIDDTFDNPPVNGVNPDITTNATIADVLAKWVPGEIVEITDDLIFTGVVVSTDEHGHFYKTLVIQDETAGIRFSINATGQFNQYHQFRRVFVKVKGLYIGDYHGLPTIGAGITQNSAGFDIIERIPSALLEKYILKGVKNEPSPVQEVTIAEIPTVGNSKLIRIVGVQFSDDDLGKTMADGNQAANRTVTDCDAGNTIIFRNDYHADFADAPVPEGNGSLEAVTGSYNGDFQLTLNKYEDLQMDGERCTGGGGVSAGAGIHESFDGITDNQDFSQEGWLNVSIIDGGRVWRGKTFQTDKYISASAYNDTHPSQESWLITPGVPGIDTMSLSFKSAQHHFTQDNLSIYISTDFDGSDVAGATWVQLSATLATSTTPNYEWVNSGVISLSDYSGTGYIAFKYVGSGPDGNTGGFNLDDIVIE